MKTHGKLLIQPLIILALAQFSPVVSNADQKPVLVPGKPGEQAVDTIIEYKSEETFSSSDTEEDSSGNILLRSKLVVGFKSGTTVAKVNELILAINGTLVRTYKKTAILEIKIPDPGNESAMNIIIEKLRVNPIVSFAFGGITPGPNENPKPKKDQNHNKTPEPVGAWSLCPLCN